jgi:predicted glycogen debranching enzyme
MPKLIRKIELPAPEDAPAWLSREWLVTNGLGGYASGTIGGVITRRFHGLLIASLPAPFGRMMMLNELTEEIGVAGAEPVQLGGQEKVGGLLEFSSARFLTDFRLENGLPVWRYETEGAVIEKRVILLHLQNTTQVRYQVVSSPNPVLLRLRPAVHFRPHEGTLGLQLEKRYALTLAAGRYEIHDESALPPLRLVLRGGEPAFVVEGRDIQEIFYRIEDSRGYDARGDLWSPGYFQVELREGEHTTLIASTEPLNVMLALDPEEAFDAEYYRRDRLLAAAPPGARQGIAAELVLAADQFVITPAGRVEDVARARASGDEIRSIIAGYHWFTDWGRDTMISLEGLTLAAGRHEEARWILKTFARYVRDGLIPNMFPEGRTEGLYHTADASLWFFHAVQRYLDVTGDDATVRLLLPKLTSIITHHLRGTRFGIAVDPQDGLLRQGQQDYQLTWMDAKVDDWVVTPRRGKAVEINALWYNALCILAGWLREYKGPDAAREISGHAERTRRSFNQRFWNPETKYLYDVVDGEHGDDFACRPNQIFAISLLYPVLDQQHWEPVVETVRERLLTPFGLRSLSRDHADYKAQYYGDLRARDAAYHQGTVWGWLVGPFIDAWLKLHPEDLAGARAFLTGFDSHLTKTGVGSIGEIFDAESPFIPRGCVAQAWSVAEVLRCLLKTTSGGMR